MLQAVLFDFNGVIVDDEHLQHGSEVEVLAAEEGIRITREQYFERYLGLDDAAFFQAVLRDHGRQRSHQQLQRLMQRKVEVYLGYLEQGVCIFPGVAALVQELAADYPLAICSGAPRREIAAVLAKAGLTRCFDQVVTFEDVETGKPDPAIFLEGLTRLRRGATELIPPGCLVIEDAPRGVQAARAAGMACLAVTNSSAAGELAAAHRVVDSLAQVTPEDLRRLVDYVAASGTDQR